MIAEAEWNDFTYEDVDRWPKERVDYYFERMGGTGALREEQRDEQQQKYAEEHDLDIGAYEPSADDRPDGIPEDLWSEMGPKSRRKAQTGQTAYSERELRNHLEAKGKLD